MQHFDEDAIKRQHAAINRYQAVTSKRHRELTRKEKEQTAMFDLVFTAHDFSSLEMTIPSAFSNINFAFQHLSSLRNQPSLTKSPQNIPKILSEEESTRQNTRPQAPLVGALRKIPSKLCFDDIVNPTETSSIESNFSVQASSRIGEGHEPLLQFQNFSTRSF
jgi:hypothetical protein